MKFIIYTICSFIIGACFKWYDLVWFNSSITYLHWVIIAFASAHFVVKTSEEVKVFKNLWQTVVSLILLLCHSRLILKMAGMGGLSNGFGGFLLIAKRQELV